MFAQEILNFLHSLGLLEYTPLPKGSSWFSVEENVCGFQSTWFNFEFATLIDRYSF